MIRYEWRSAPYVMLGGNGIYIAEHRARAAEMLGRPLAPNEVVHHIDRNKRNNDPENLRIMTRQDHARLHARQRWQVGRYGGRCVICEQWGRPPGICLDCQTAYGLLHLKYEEYPEWVRYLIRERMTESRRRERWTGKEISLDALLERGGDIDRSGTVYGCDNEDPSEELLERYAPYADEATNRAYRRANGIKERDRE